ncbi:hypothetical protein AB1Y20_016320 [Prymnesium parvum]|uniref:Uncharacterized protein n=1 Tax=Prymnesium parvum TaxID=97485 RepID=A0AB34IEU5_PRYPA
MREAEAARGGGLGALGRLDAIGRGGEADGIGGVALRVTTGHWECSAELAVVAELSVPSGVAQCHSGAAGATAVDVPAAGGRTAGTEDGACEASSSATTSAVSKDASSKGEFALAGETEVMGAADKVEGATERGVVVVAEAEAVAAADAQMVGAKETEVVGAAAHDDADTRE